MEDGAFGLGGGFRPGSLRLRGSVRVEGMRKGGAEPRVVVNGETAIKPYWYLRNGLLHVRYVVDRCLELTESEESLLKAEMAAAFDKRGKQKALEKAWRLCAGPLGRPVVMDGVSEIDRRIREGARHGED